MEQKRKVWANFKKNNLGKIHHMSQNSELDQIKTYWRLSEIACLNPGVLCYILFYISDLGITCLDPRVLWYMLFYISDSEASIWKGEKKIQEVMHHLPPLVPYSSTFCCIYAHRGICSCPQSSPPDSPQQICLSRTQGERQSLVFVGGCKIGRR